ncbi:decapping and exoribonuclease protein [Anabrus simplex]|uniref:decapping and exoribonuclease protein n=1 Tax=Anabrus simplex TaxID=316456 RepID=UPI0034DCE5E1
MSWRDRRFESRDGANEPRKNLRVHRSDYMAAFPSFQRPVVSGYFSLDSERKYCPDMTELKYIYMPSNLNDVKFDLNKGVESMVRSINEYPDEKLDNILKWILQNKNMFSNEYTRPLADFVCYRGLLTMIMCTPFEQREGWIILATKWKGMMYLCAKETEEARIQREQYTEKQKRFMAWGFKFEDYLTSEKPDIKPNSEQPLIGKPEFCVVFRGKLDSHRILFGAEMDGIVNKTEVKNLEELQKAEFVELKTSRVIQHERQYENFTKYKLIKWWGQSFLVGIERVLCGYRDDRGVVHQIQEHKVKDLPKLAKKAWDPSVCMNFCNSFLSFTKTVVQEDDPSTVWKFVWTPGSDVTYTKVPGPSELTFLPKWFTKESKSTGGI